MSILWAFLFQLVLAASNDSSTPVAPSVCQIHGVPVGSLVSRNNIGPLSTVSRKSEESLPADFEPSPLVPIPYDFLNPIFSDDLAKDGEFEYIEENTLRALTLMLEDARRDNVRIFVHSAYRPYNIQCSIFSKKVKKEMQSLGLSLQNAILQVNTRSAMPGQSEHQLGTAVDLVADIPSIGYKLEYQLEQTLTFAWLQKNAYRYGFVLSFPKGESLDHTHPNPKTGYIYEPWHWRYIHPHYAYRFQACQNQLPLVDFLRALNRDPTFDCKAALGI